ncbi:MAG: hypothetical protein LBT18_01905 [Endomicrobium sp.]|nr:hypothetical protein [Endomicrobium sp.]
MTKKLFLSLVVLTLVTSLSKFSFGYEHIAIQLGNQTSIVGEHSSYFKRCQAEEYNYDEYCPEIFKSTISGLCTYVPAVIGVFTVAAINPVPVFLAVGALTGKFIGGDVLCKPILKVKARKIADKVCPSIEKDFHNFGCFQGAVENLYEEYVCKGDSQCLEDLLRIHDEL